MPKRPASVNTTLLLIALSVLIWLALGIIYVADLHPAIPHEPLIRSVVAAGSFAAAGVLLVTMKSLIGRNRIAYYLVLATLGGLCILILLDQVGWIDLLVLAINLVPLALLVKDRAWYLGEAAGFASRL